MNTTANARTFADMEGQQRHPVGARIPEFRFRRERGGVGEVRAIVAHRSASAMRRCNAIAMVALAPASPRSASRLPAARRSSASVVASLPSPSSCTGAHSWLLGEGCMGVPLIRNPGTIERLA